MDATSLSGDPLEIVSLVKTEAEDAFYVLSHIPDDQNGQELHIRLLDDNSAVLEPVVSREDEALSPGTYHGPWTKRAAFELLQLYSKYKTDFANPFKKKTDLWRVVSSEMNKQGMGYSPELCDKKMRMMKYRYRDLKKSGDERLQKTWMFYSAVEAALEGLPIGDIPPALAVPLTLPEDSAITEPASPVSDDAFADVVDTDHLVSSWSDEAVLLLLDLYAQHKEAIVDPTLRKGQIWEMISMEMKAKGYQYSQITVGKKVSQMTKKYEEIMKKGVQRTTQWKFFSKVQETLTSVSSNPVETSIQWTTDDIKALMQSFREHQEEFEVPDRTKIQAWGIIADDLSSKGISVSAVACSKKMSSLICRYKKIIDDNSSECEDVWEFFPAVDNLFKNRPVKEAKRILEYFKASTNFCGMGTVAWPHAATELLLQQAIKYKRELQATEKRRLVLFKVAKMLKDRGFNFTWQNCEKKLRSLRHRYQLIRKRKTHTNWNYFSTVHELYHDIVFPRTSFVEETDGNDKISGGSQMSASANNSQTRTTTAARPQMTATVATHSSNTARGSPGQTSSGCSRTDDHTYNQAGSGDNQAGSRDNHGHKKQLPRAADPDSNDEDDNHCDPIDSVSSDSPDEKPVRKRRRRHRCRHHHQESETPSWFQSFVMQQTQQMTRLMEMQQETLNIARERNEMLNAFTLIVKQCMNNKNS